MLQQIWQHFHVSFTKNMQKINHIPLKLCKNKLTMFKFSLLLHHLELKTVLNAKTKWPNEFLQCVRTGLTSETENINLRTLHLIRFL